MALASACGAPASKAPEASSETAANVTITHLPSPFWTVVEGAFAEQSATPDDGHAQTQNLTWLLHPALASREREPLRIERVEVTFSTGGQPQWSEVFSEPYLRRLEWIKGAFDMTPDYYLDKVLHGSEEAGGPEIPAGGTLSWVRIPFGRPWFARAEAVAFRFQFKDPAGRTSVATHTVPIAEYRQKDAPEGCPSPVCGR